MKRILIAIAMVFGLFGLAAASECPKDMAAIDAELAKNPDLSAEDMARVKELRAEGEMLHKEGKHADSVEALHEAMAILKIEK